MVAATESVAAKLRIQPGYQVVVVANAPPGRSLIIPITGEADPRHADVVIGFVTHRADLESLSPVYAAAIDGRLAWIGYRCDSGLCSDWLTNTVPGYGVEATECVALNDTWSAILLRAALAPEPHAFDAETSSYPTKSETPSAPLGYRLRLAYNTFTETT